NDLLVATHGRAFWALDDLSPLQQYKPEVANEEVHLYTPSAANHTTFGGGFGGGGGERGQNPPNGAVIYYSLKTALKKPGEKKPEEKKAEGVATAAAPSKETSTEGKEPGQAHPADAPVPPKSEAATGETA